MDSEPTNWGAKRLVRTKKPQVADPCRHSDDRHVGGTDHRLGLAQHFERLGCRDKESLCGLLGLAERRCDLFRFFASRGDPLPDLDHTKRESKSSPE